MSFVDGIREACSRHPEGWNAYKTIDGKAHVRTGLGIDLYVGDYLLPDERTDPDRVLHRDLREMGPDGLSAEAARVEAMLKEVHAAKERGKLAHVMVDLPLGGCESVEMWGSERLADISRLTIYGRR